MKETVTAEKVQAAFSNLSPGSKRHGETSFDHQSYFASDLGRSAKALYYRKPLLGVLAVSPMILSEAFVPSARRLFWKPQRFPIADAHYAMGLRLPRSGSRQNRTSSTLFIFSKCSRRHVVRASAITPGATHSTGKHATEPLKKDAHDHVRALCL